MSNPKREGPRGGRVWPRKQPTAMKPVLQVRGDRNEGRKGLVAQSAHPAAMS
jgi:hypothetical protein